MSISTSALTIALNKTDADYEGLISNWADGVRNGWVLQYDPSDPCMSAYGKEAWETQCDEASFELVMVVVDGIEMTKDKPSFILERALLEVEELLHGGEFM